ncbi:MAG: N-acetylmuramoyl-L-alanine amidase [Victivallaceae bacterium]|nr:N-acetylmuramoyl-L-alanine amidase [Victivallaceae bacterium]
MKLRRLLLCMAVFAAALGAEAAVTSISKVRTGTFFSRRYARFADVASYLKMRMTEAKSGMRLLTLLGRSSASFRPDQRPAVINGMPIILNYAPLWQGGRAWLSWSDLISTMLPLYQRSSLRRHTPIHIVIDPGHGGSDPGASGRVSKEKNITLSMAFELKRQLESRYVTIQGKRTRLRVTLTRSGDSTVSLEQRAAICNRARGQLFISLHADAASPSVSGIGTFSLTPPGAPSYNASKVVNERSTGQAWCNNSLFFAYCVQKNIVSKIKDTSNRGLKRARFSVLRNTDCPSVLVETGFITNTREERNLNSSAYRKRLAAAIADGVVEYIGQVRSSK